MAQVNVIAVRSCKFEQADVDAWAALSTDFNPIHVDPEYAAQTPFGGTIAHGHLTLSLMIGLVHELRGDAWLHGGRIEKVRFRAPLRPGHPYQVRVLEHDGRMAWRVEVTATDGTVVAEGQCPGGADG